MGKYFGCRSYSCQFPYSVIAWLLLIICALCLVIIDLTLFMQLYLTFKVFLLKLLFSLCCNGKCLSIKLKNSRPMFVHVNTLTKWWVEPNYVALPIPTCPFRCILSVRKFVIKVTMSKGVLVNRRRFLKCLFVR